MKYICHTMRKYSAVIIDDESKSVGGLSNLLRLYCPEISVVGTADSVISGRDIIQKFDPDIVFLDIEMRTGTGFDLLKSLKNLDFEVIFTTAYDNYAIKAIRFNAIDYLLKPIDIDELMQAVARAVNKISQTTVNENLKSLLDCVRDGDCPRLSISTLEGFLFYELQEIVRCEAKGPYTIFFLRDGSSVTSSKNLKEYEMLLSEYHFFRVHHSHLINITDVRKMLKLDGNMIELKNGTHIPIAQNRKEMFLQKMQTIKK